MSYQAKIPVSKTALWSGRILSALPIPLLLLSVAMKLMRHPEAVKGFAAFGYPDNTLLPIAIVELVCTILYVIPQTAVLGAILLTGYLGGATGTHVRAGEPWLPAVLMGVVLWIGLYLRDPRLRELAPLRRLK
jgi:hypothetical protein